MLVTLRRNCSPLIPLQNPDLVFERLSLLHEAGYHRVFSSSEWAASPFTGLNDIARQPEQRIMLSFLMADQNVVPHVRISNAKTGNGPSRNLIVFIGPDYSRGADHFVTCRDGGVLSVDGGYHFPGNGGNAGFEGKSRHDLL